MIEVRRAEAWEVGAEAILRPIAADGSAVTPAMRRLDQAAGPAVAAQLGRLGELPVGSAVVTGPGDLPSTFLIHVVVRSMEEPVSVAGVKRALLNGLRRAAELSIDSVALVPLGTGAGNLEADVAAEAMFSVLMGGDQVEALPSRIVVATDSEYEREAFDRELRRRFAVASGGIAAADAGDSHRPEP